MPLLTHKYTHLIRKSKYMYTEKSYIHENLHVRSYLHTVIWTHLIHTSTDRKSCFPEFNSYFETHFGALIVLELFLLLLSESMGSSTSYGPRQGRAATRGKSPHLPLKTPSD